MAVVTPKTPTTATSLHSVAIVRVSPHSNLLTKELSSIEMMVMIGSLEGADHNSNNHLNPLTLVKHDLISSNLMDRQSLKLRVISSLRLLSEVTLILAKFVSKVRSMMFEAKN